MRASGTRAMRCGVGPRGAVRHRAVARVAVGAVAVAAIVVAPALPVAAAPLAPQPVGAVETPPNPAACLRPTTPAIAPEMLNPTQLGQRTWPEERLHYTSVWQYGDGAGVTVAVVDSGVDAKQEHLAGRVLPGYDVTAGPAAKPGANTDCRAHGTMVAGILAGRPIPGRAFAGVAPAARILPIRQTWGINSQGQNTAGSAANLIRGINLAVALGAPIVNVSVVVDGHALNAAERSQMVTAIRNARAHDVLIVAASDNKSEGGGQQQVVLPYPAALADTFDNVMAVGGIDASGAIGSDTNVRSFVSVVAPESGMPCPMPGGGLVQCHGTSFATPFVSGLAADLLSRDPSLTAAQLKQRIELTADHPSTNLPDRSGGFGWGVINPLAAATQVLATGGRPQPRGAGPLPPPTPPDTRSALIGTATTVGAVAAVVVIAIAGVVIPRGRRRRWRPGRIPVVTPTAVGTPSASGSLPAG